MINLGDKVKDKVSGFQGIAVCRHSYLEGCDRITVQPSMGEDKKLPDQASFDEPQLEILQAGVVLPNPSPSADRTGGPEKYPDSPRG